MASVNSWAFSLQVVALPLSDTSVPKSGLASTLTHGAGVIRVVEMLATYSRPSAEKPLFATAADSGAADARELPARPRDAGGSARQLRATCAANVPAASEITMRATLSSSVRSPSSSFALSRTKTPPDLSSRSALGPELSAWLIASKSVVAPRGLEAATITRSASIPWARQCAWARTNSFSRSIPVGLDI